MRNLIGVLFFADGLVCKAPYANVIYIYKQLKWQVLQYTCTKINKNCVFLMVTEEAFTDLIGSLLPN